MSQAVRPVMGDTSWLVVIDTVNLNVPAPERST